MTRSFLLVLSLVLFATCVLVQGQYGSSSSQQSDQSQTGTAASSQTSGQTTIEGCLQASGDNYTLTDNASGKTYQIQGDTSKLSAHNGHEVQLTGTASGDTGSAGGMTSGAGASQQPTFVVSKLKHISTTCKSSK